VSILDDIAPERTARAAAVGMRRVLIDRLELIGSIGIYEREKRYEQRIVVSLELMVVDRYDGRSDRIGDVYDYDHALAAARDVVASGHFNLIETVAERVAQGCLAHPDVRRVRVRVEKPDIVDSCGSVGIEIERRRGDW
jgi:dihydroneopterin aldolase